MLVDNQTREEGSITDLYPHRQSARGKTLLRSRVALVKLQPEDIIDEETVKLEAFNKDASKKSLSPLMRGWQLLSRTPLMVVAVVIGLITLCIHGYRVDVAPDVFSDEGLYLQVGINLARGYGLVVNHAVFLWHPPVYMLLEAAYIRLAGLTNADALTTLLGVRHINVIVSALTAMLIVFFGQKLHSRSVGVVAAIIFILDPYVQRINRRSMLETVAMFFILLGLYIFYTHQRRLTKWQRLGSGLAFGMALLTKEAIFPELCVLIVYTIIFNREQIRDALWVFATACALYLVYPATMLAIGQGSAYFAFKFFGVTRVVSLVTGTKAAPPKGTYLPAANKLTFVHNLLARTTPYLASYLLIGCAALFTIVLLLWFRKIGAARYLVTWCIFSLGFGGVLINISDQYAYFLIVPSTIVVGYVLVLLVEAILHAPLPKKIAQRNGAILPWVPIKYRTMWLPIVMSVLAVLIFNGVLWYQTYAIGVDDGYIKTIRYVTAHLPAGANIVTSDDVTVYLLPSTYHIRLDRDRDVITSMNTCYFIMSSKDAIGQYDAMTPDFYDWVIQGTYPLIEQKDLSFGDIGIYQKSAQNIHNMCVQK